MRCDHDLLLDLLDGELDGARRREVEEHLASCEDCRRAAEAYESDLALVGEALGAGGDGALSDAELDALLSAPELREDAETTGRPRRLFRHPRAVAALALAACVAAALLLMPPPAEEAFTIPPSPAAPVEADERVEIRMATGNPSIQVIWVMSKDVDF